MDYATLRDMHPGTLIRASEEYMATAMNFAQTADNWDKQVCTASQQAWTGQAADAAEAPLKTTSNRLTDASSLLKQNAEQLSAAGDQFLQLQQQLQQLIAWSQQNGLVIHDDGSVTPNPQAPQGPGGAVAQASAQAMLAAELADVLARATAVDQSTSKALDMNAQSVGSGVAGDPADPGQHGQPADPGGPSQGGHAPA
ncbi:hypothetical protein P3T35_003744 [Kitasatospora sp. GP30]|jgi:hypothetical protein|uniref:hypothetical protein n=1 Tax=Kitasatospora sp. GP30 TaxID=3035084 RepID=UPI000C70AE3C|nr:hypothetical protein [Kitasatospora sp. GP30]MDH6141723.1 hypothetical protein [Kitasatospora sp. GP30]